MTRFLFAALCVAVFSLVATVSHTSPFCVGALHAQAQWQDPLVMPPPGGNPDHSEPPKGAFCDNSNRPAHHCECHIECATDEDGNSYYTGITECRAYCHEDHCKCPAKNCPQPTGSQ